MTEYCFVFLLFSSDNIVCSLSFLKHSRFSCSALSTSVVVSVLSTIVIGSVFTLVSVPVLIGDSVLSKTVTVSVLTSVLGLVLIAVAVSVLTAIKFQYWLSCQLHYNQT